MGASHTVPSGGLDPLYDQIAQDREELYRRVIDRCLELIEEEHLLEVDRLSETATRR